MNRNVKRLWSKGYIFHLELLTWDLFILLRSNLKITHFANLEEKEAHSEMGMLTEVRGGRH